MTQDSRTTVDGSATPARPPAARPVVGTSTDEWLARISDQLDHLAGLLTPPQPAPDPEPEPVVTTAKKPAPKARRASVTGQ